MVSESLRLVSGALRILLLCVLMLLPVFRADRGPLVGGWRDRSVSDADVREAAAFAVDTYNRRSNSLYYSRSQRVIKAQSQVVEGIKYYLKILLVNTQCDKRSSRGLAKVDLERCALPPKADQQAKHMMLSTVGLNRKLMKCNKYPVGHYVKLKCNEKYGDLSYPTPAFFNLFDPEDPLKFFFRPRGTPENKCANSTSGAVLG